MSLPRRTLRPLAWLALSAFLSGVALPLYDEHPLGGADDESSQLVFGATDNGTTRIGWSGPKEAQPEHCVFCHLQRAMSGAFAADVASLAKPFLNATCPVFAEGFTLTGADVAHPSRAPPAPLTI